MKTQLSQLSRRRGSALVLTLVITGVLGFILVAYLTLVRSQNVSNTRSQAWNQAMPVIEAGVEDALAHLAKNGTTNLHSDNWHQLGNIIYMKRWVGQNYYVVTITNWETGTPVIQSRGFVSAPTIMASAPGPFLAAIATFGAPAQYMGRGVRVSTGQAGRYKGMNAKNKIDLNGNNIATDSFDSTSSSYSTAGKYDFFKHRDHGDVSTTAGLTNAINVGNANIWGKLATGPHGTISIGPNGAVGNAAWQIANKKGVQPGYCTDDMNVDFKDVEVPFTGGYNTPVGGDVDGTTYTYVLDGGNYKLDDLSSGTICCKGVATLYVPGGVSLSGITITSNACLSLYVGGASVSLSGNGVVNQAGYASNFFYFGLPSNTYLKLSGNGQFVGVIYAPNADFDLKGGGNNDLDFIGASVTKTVTMNGHMNFHYDESLESLSTRAFVVTSWDEMDPQEFNACVIDTSPNDVIN
jgi:hypothetical protein